MYPQFVYTPHVMSSFPGEYLEQFYLLPLNKIENIETSVYDRKRNKTVKNYIFNGIIATILKQEMNQFNSIRSGTSCQRISILLWKIKISLLYLLTISRNNIVFTLSVVLISAPLEWRYFTTFKWYPLAAQSRASICS